MTDNEFLMDLSKGLAAIKQFPTKPNSLLIIANPEDQRSLLVQIEGALKANNIRGVTIKCKFSKTINRGQYLIMRNDERDIMFYSGENRKDYYEE